MNFNLTKQEQDKFKTLYVYGNLIYEKSKEVLLAKLNEQCSEVDILKEFVLMIINFSAIDTIYKIAVFLKIDDLLQDERKPHDIFNNDKKLIEEVSNITQCDFLKGVENSITRDLKEELKEELQQVKNYNDLVLIIAKTIDKLIN